MIKDIKEIEKRIKKCNVSEFTFIYTDDDDILHVEILPEGRSCSEFVDDALECCLCSEDYENYFEHLHNISGELLKSIESTDCDFALTTDSKEIPDEIGYKYNFLVAEIDFNREGVPLKIHSIPLESDDYMFLKICDAIHSNF